METMLAARNRNSPPQVGREERPTWTVRLLAEISNRPCPPHELDELLAVSLTI